MLVLPILPLVVIPRHPRQPDNISRLVMKHPHFLLGVNPFALFALTMFIVAGCNAFGFMYEEGNSDDPDVILDDARIALQNGDTEKAIELLEKALDKAPDNPVIKIELASALFQDGDVDLLVMKDLADYISDSGAASSTKSASAPAVCTFTESPSSTRQLSFDTEAAYQTLQSNTDILERSIELLSRELNLNISSELSENLTSNAYLMRAIATMGASVLAIKSTADSLGASLHQRSNGSIGYCAPTPAAVTEMESFVLCEQLPIFDAAIDDLLNRQQLLGLNDSELVDAVEAARNELSNTASLSCSPFYPAESQR